MRGPDGTWRNKLKATGLDIITPKKVYKKHKIESYHVKLNFQNVRSQLILNMLEKYAGFKALFVMRMDRKFCFVSNAEPAAAHDIQRLNQYQKPIIDNLGENKAIVLDKGFTGFVPELPKDEWLIVHKRPKSGDLTKEDRKLTWFGILLRRS
jgi:hypothetical protein